MKKIVITGATKGIGRAIALKFGTAGFNLALCARTMKDLEGLKAEIAVASKANILIHACDVSKREELKGFADKVLNEFGAVDILVNNAGIFLPGQVFNEDDSILEKLINTNLYSAYYMSKWLLPPMTKRMSGHIFNLCSVASIKAYPNGGSYGISKFAMLGLSKALREELQGFNIKVTALLAGATLTDSWAGTDLPPDRFMKAEDVAQIVWDVYHLSANTVVEEILLRPMQGDIDA